MHEDIINVQYPLPIDGDSIYYKDIDWDNSDFTNWVGRPSDLFLSPFSKPIVNSTSNNPKTITIAFKRTLKALQIGLGTNSGDFSNVKISLIGSGGTVRRIFDRIGDSTKKTSLNAEFVNDIFNSIIIEFHTADTVSLSNLTIQKAQYSTTQIQGKSPDGDFVTFGASRKGNFSVALAEYQSDAFGRLRTSEPYSVFDSSLTSDQAYNLFWSTLINGTGDTVYSQPDATQIHSTAADGDYVVSQTYQRFKYQPGKSTLVLMTGLLATETNIRKRIGLVDYDNQSVAISNIPRNGIYFQNNSGTLSWNIVKNATTQTSTETAERSSWNIDPLDGTGPSGKILNIDNINIFYLDLEWLSAGGVRVGFVLDGEYIVCHEFQHASNGFTQSYMRTANLPCAYEITQTGTGSGSLDQICTSVISEGGFNPRGVSHTVVNTAEISTAADTPELLLGLRLKPEAFEFSAILEKLKILQTTADVDSIIRICFRPTYPNPGTVTWNDVDSSNFQYAFGNGDSVSDFGVEIGGDLLSGVEKASSSLTTTIQNTISLGKGLDDSLDEIWIVAESLDDVGTYRAMLTFKDLM